MSLFSNDQINDAFVEHLHFAQNALGFDLYAWVVMPEHIHILIRPAEYSQTVTQILRRIKSPFARRVLATWRKLDAPILSRIADLRGKPRFWQPGGGYDRNVHSDEELIEKVSYIHANPVRRGLAAHEIEYRWSSAAIHLEEEQITQRVATDSQ